MPIDGTVYYVLRDRLGSAYATTDASGNVVGEMRYYAFGETRLSTGNMFTDRLFTGQRQIAELGIYHFNARFYSPTLGRFLSADTLISGFANPQNLNRFSYVANNPLRYTDPTGHMLTEYDGGAGGCYGSTCTPISTSPVKYSPKPTSTSSGDGGGAGSNDGSGDGGGGWGVSIDYNVSAMYNNFLGGFGINGTDVAYGLDILSTVLDGIGLAIDTGIAIGDVVSAVEGAFGGGFLSIPTGGEASVFTVPAGAAVGMGLFEVAARPFMIAGNVAASISTYFTTVSDILTGETNASGTLSISTNNGFQFSNQTTVGRDTITSAGLTTAGWISPIGLTSAPLAGAAFANDLGLLYSGPLSGVPTYFSLPEINISIP